MGDTPGSPYGQTLIYGSRQGEHRTLKLTQDNPNINEKSPQKSE
jgi:hypothetical protein